ncbi:MAG: glycosyltransferase [Saprospiraceae bacterium]|nr:glycosyltransferase [Saprospiraceae bacterium]
MKNNTILFFFEGLLDPQIGGVQKIIFKLGRYFHAKGFNVIVIVISGDEYHEVSLPFGKAIIFKKNTPENEICNIIIKLNPQIVLNEMPYVKSFQYILTLMRNEIKFVSFGCLNNSLFSVKNNLPIYVKEVLGLYPNNKLIQWILCKTVLLIHKYRHKHDLKKILKYHDYFVLPTSSSGNIEELKYFISKYNSLKVIGIDNSIELPKKAVNFEEKEKYLLYVGRINVSQKRSDLLPHIWNGIKDSLPDWEFHILGDGEYMNELRQAFQYENRVVLHGFRNPDEYYKRSLIFINPTAFEGFPSTLLEAQSYGVIPVAFNSYPVLPYILDYGNSGIIIKSFDVEDFCSSLIKLASDRQQLQYHFNFAISNVKKFSIEVIGQKWIEKIKPFL